MLGSTLDDAAGEAFDKGARLLGLGYPGGAELDRLAREGDPEAFAFPVARVPGLDFSFSGLKTALLYAVRELDEAELERRRADLAASYQRAIVRALVGRLARRGRADGPRHGRGRRRRRGELRASRVAAGRAFAPLALCTDNAAMVASAGRFAAPVPLPGYLALDAYASSRRSSAPSSRSLVSARRARRRRRLGRGRHGRRRRGLAGAPREPPAARARRPLDRRPPGAVARRPRAARRRARDRGPDAHLDGDGPQPRSAGRSRASSAAGRRSTRSSPTSAS